MQAARLKQVNLEIENGIEEQKAPPVVKKDTNYSLQVQTGPEADQAQPVS